MSFANWLLGIAILIIFIGLFLLISQVHQSVKLCSSINEMKDITRIDGVYMNDGFIGFNARGDGVDTLFHEMCHYQVSQDYNHFCEVSN